MVLGLLEALSDDGSLVVAEGYMWETERRGFLQMGAFLPEVVIERPDIIRSIHEEFVLAGSDVVEAFTYYAYRQQLKRQGKEDIVEKLNRDALKIAREVADKHGKLMAGNISNTPLYVTEDASTHQLIYEQYREQVCWAVQGGADYIIGETHSSYGEAEIALKAIKEHGQGLPAVITLTAFFPDRTTDEVVLPEACRRLEGLGASVVGLNCSRGPDSILPLAKKIKKACTCPVACLPVPYRTTPKEMTFFSLEDPRTGENLYPANLDCVRCSREDIRRFAKEALESGIQYVGLCCGNAPNLTREIAEVYGKCPPASKYSCDITKSVVFGNDSSTFSEHSNKKWNYMMGVDC
ncbi:betaine--homocysteine S-methyltransferase 1-like [Mya arenaria]|uniref:betaine--homocysteine S-methyltransferase 1-like n=1 Tax=Mya arenaria TaxID=6604 RepID=UPI0022E3665F|nr:betaine--homocysteine S-methyltransferase 1-like [Mya arenaria]